MYEEYYKDYINSVSNMNINNIQNSNFKYNNNYSVVLEHVNYDKGIQYLKLIQSEFEYIPFQYIVEFISINDKYGSPMTYSFDYIYNQKIKLNIVSSPTTLRYIYHALTILDNYKKLEKTLPIVEIGCGYGGLFLAICYFSKKLGIHIPHYNMIDYPEICNLIDCYIKCNNVDIIPYSLYSCHTYGDDIKDNQLYLISNYCFTEIDEVDRNKYIDILFKKVEHGFIIWQTVYNLNIQNVNIINKNIQSVEFERPQTAPEKTPNYFVYF